MTRFPHIARTPAMFAAVAALALSACTARPEADALGASAFNTISPLPPRVFGSPDDVIRHYLAGVGREFPTTRELRRNPAAPGTVVVIFSAEGYEDDSVSGEQWRVALGQTDMGYRVVEAGKRQKCYRAPQGVSAGQWTRERCL